MRGETTFQLVSLLSEPQQDTPPRYTEPLTITRLPTITVNLSQLWAPPSSEQNIQRSPRAEPCQENTPEPPRLHVQTPPRTLLESLGRLRRRLTRSLTPSSPQRTEVSVSTPSSPSLQAPDHATSKLRKRNTARGFKCEEPTCQKTFPSSQALRKHQRYHNKPHRCQQCDRRFVTITHLTRHVNDVHERQEHYCPVGGCEYSLAAGNGKSFAREWNLTRHLRNMH